MVSSITTPTRGSDYEETKEKEAELTGDEAVLNPEQTDNTMQAFKILKDAVAKMENPPEELLQPWRR